MRRFKGKKNRSPFLSLLLSVAVSLGVIFLLFLGIQTLSAKTVAEQKVSLEKAISRSVVECYAAEGAYPPSLDYMKEHYALSYNSDIFFVDYQPIGENILPQITVIVRE